jgi:hypothetical protein
MGWFKKLRKKVKKVVKQTVKHAVEAVASVPEAIVEDVFDEVEHVATGIWDLATGDPNGAKKEFQRAKDAAKELVSDFAVGPIGATILIGVSVVSGVQRIFNLQAEPRRLTTDERNVLTPIFRDSIDYDEVQIVEGNLGILDGKRWKAVAGTARSAPYTIGYTIYVPSQWLDKATNRIPLDTLVHEVTHVWQYENGGPDYAPEAVYAQATGNTGAYSTTPGYDFDNALAAGKRWAELGPEQQAAFIEYAYSYPPATAVPGASDRTDVPAGLPIDFAANPVTGPLHVPFPAGPDYTSQLVDALESLRGGFGGP